MHTSVGITELEFTTQLEECVCVYVCVCVCVCARACSLTFCDHMREVTGAGVWMKPMGSYPSLMLRKNTVESLLCIYKIRMYTVHSTYQKYIRTLQA